MKNTLGLILIFAGVLLFSAMSSRYHSGNGIDGPSQTVELGVPGSPWLAFACTQFNEVSPRGCAEWQSYIHWKSFSWLGLIALVIGSRLTAKPGRRVRWPDARGPL
jgi:hypothetical protein